MNFSYGGPVAEKEHVGCQSTRMRISGFVLKLKLLVAKELGPNFGDLRKVQKFALSVVSASSFPIDFGRELSGNLDPGADRFPGLDNDAERAHPG